MAVLFASAADQAQAAFHWAVGLWAPMPFVIMPLGLALSAWLTQHYFANAQGSGIPQVMAARHLSRPEARSRLLSLRIAAGKVLLTVFGLACGASIGREGPTVQVSATLMLMAGTWAGLGRYPGLILAGGAAGVAAAFNTPLAGIVFAIEELARNFEHRSNSWVLSTVIIAGLVAMALVGDYNYFGSTGAVIGWHHWYAVIAAGVMGGVNGGLFSLAVVKASARLPTLFGGRLARHPTLFAAACGLILAAIGAASGGMTYGTGYDEARLALEGKELLPWEFGPLKLLATVVSTIAGIPGGIFAPSLSVGAGAGAFLASVMPGSPAGAVIVLGMAGYFSGVVQAPLTAVVIIVEMTAGQGMLLPLLVTSILASGIARLICREPIYHALAMRILNRHTSSAS
ncbi:MAG: chloride channel protein [Azospirillum sp.]|nr:chloride channel protein [Azospirillum sp.]